MADKKLRLPFVLASTDQGLLIVNRMDYHVDSEIKSTYGIGLELLDTANYEPGERDVVIQLLGVRRRFYGDGVVALDIGANLGPHTVAWARAMTDWGHVLAFEPQEWPYYALAGNLAINNCLNAGAVRAAVGAETGTIGVPALDPAIACNFGGLELMLQPGQVGHQSLGAPVNRDADRLVTVGMITLDSLNLRRVDLAKIDAEGMELDVIRGARETIKRCHPILFVEWVKSNQEELINEIFALGYPKIYRYGMNLITIHAEDLCRDSVNFTDVEETKDATSV